MTTSATSFNLATGVLIALHMVVLASTATGSAQEPDVRSPSSPATQFSEVRVNGQVLTASQVAQLEQFYHVRPLPGSRWYDALSGLYRPIGGPAVGLMYPGHKLGPLAEDASGGDTLVYVNHRRIPLSEWSVWSAIVVLQYDLEDTGWIREATWATRGFP